MPEEFRLAADESIDPLRELTEERLRQSENVLTTMRAMLKERATQSVERSDRVQTWLKSDQAKEFLRRAPQLKEAFVSAAAAAEALPKEQATAITARLKRSKK